MGITWISTWTHPLSQDCGDPTYGAGEQESACGFCHYWCGFYHYWGGFLSLLDFSPLFFSSQISTVKVLKAVCKQGSGSAREAKGTATHMETAENEQDTENTPKTHPKHLRHPKPRQNDPNSNRICEGKFTPVWRKQHRRESQPW